MTHKNLLKDYTILYYIVMNIYKQIINYTFFTFNKKPQEKHDNFCKNNFFVTLQFKATKISKGENTRYIYTGPAKIRYANIYMFVARCLAGPHFLNPSNSLITHVKIMIFVPKSTLNLPLFNNTTLIIFIQSLHLINYKNNPNE